MVRVFRFHIWVTLLFVLGLSGGVLAQDFVTTWKTDNSGPSDDDQITIPTVGTGYNYDIDWGDGTSDTGVSGDITHTYSTPGEYTVSISGDFPRIFFDAGGFFGSDTDHDKILTIEQWGNISWSSMESAFSGCSNLQILATDAPDLSLVTNLSAMFLEAEVLNADLSSWDVSTVTDMHRLFMDCIAFNQPLDSWNVGNVTNMSEMFRDAESFNQSLNSWDVSNVTNMEEMFFFARAFNGNITSWNVDNVTNLASMFAVTQFDQDISGWNVGSATSIEGIFFGTPFNQPIGSWDVSNVQNFSNVFRQAELFNQDISSWSVSNGTNMFSMFSEAIAFNQDISGWDVSNVTRMGGMFSGAVVFNQDISGWNVSNVTYMARMFQGAIAFSADITGWDVSGVRDMDNMFALNTTFNQDISGWNVGNADDMRGMFGGATSFNQDISGWNVSSVEFMIGMFQGATAFDQNLASWDVTSLRNASDMFSNSGLSIENYDNILIGWNSQTVRTNVNFSNTGIRYCDGASARAELIANNNWFINDGGLGCISVYDGPTTASDEIINGQPEPIDFGSVNVLPGSKSRSFTILNRINTDLTNVNISISGTVFGANPAGPSTIAVGNSIIVDVTLSGSTVGSYTETVTITSDDFSGSVQFDVTGVITATAEPEIVVFEGNSVAGNEIQNNPPFPIYIGEELRGMNVTDEFTITNKGSAPLLISDISFSGTAFSIGSAVPTSIAVDAVEVIQIVLDGSVGGFFTETLSISSNDTDESAFNFEVEGSIVGPDIAVYQGTVIFSPPDEIFDGQVTSIDLGTGPQGSDITQQFTITNLNGLDLEVSNIIVSGTAFSINASTPFTVGREQDGQYDEEVFEIILSGGTPGIFNETVTIINDDDDEPTFTFPVRGQIGAGFPEIAVFGSGNLEILDGQSTAFDFGSQVQGTGINETFTIENQGTNDLTITAISVSGSDFSINSAITFPLVISAGSSELLDIFLSGATIGTFSETITIASDDADESLFEIPITGEITASAEPEIAVFEVSPFQEITSSQPSVSFGTQTQGNSISKQFQIDNIGTADLDIASISISGTAFSITSTIPPSLAPSSNVRIDIELAGGTIGSFTETVTIVSNDGDEGTFTFSITGEITPGNSAPTISSINDLVIDEDANTETVSFIIKDSETNATDLLVSVSSDNIDLFDAGSLQLAGLDTARTISLTPLANANGMATLTLTVNDGQATASESFMVTVNAVNDAPIITGQETLTTAVNTPITLLNEDFTVTDIDNDFPTGFSLNIGQGSNFTSSGNILTPSDGFIGTLTVPVTINDGADDSPVFNAVLTVVAGELAVELSGEALANGDILSFDDLLIGTEDSRELVISNTGTTTLVITDIQVNGDDFRLDSAIPGPIAPGDNTTLSIVFQPTSVGPKNAVLTIISASADPFQINLTANGLSEAPPLEIFNVVTTQQNGKHDFFEIRNIEFYTSNQVIIYNRWGNEVYKTENYNNTDNRFVGISNGGTELPDGTYYYLIKLNGEEIVKNGFLLVRR